MSVDAVAIVRVPYAEICTAHQKPPAADVATALDQTFPFVPVGTDATACFLLIRYDSSPEELAIATRQRIGVSLDAHRDPRGVPLLPDVAWPERGFASYEAAAARVERFVPQLDQAGLLAAVEAGLRESGLGDLAPEIARLNAEHGGRGAEGLPAQMAAIEKLMAGHPEAARAAETAMQAHLACATAEAKARPAPLANPFPGFPIDLGSTDILATAQQLLAGMAPDQRHALEQMAAQLLSGATPPRPSPIDDEFEDHAPTDHTKPPIVDDEFTDDPPSKFNK